MHGSIFVVLKQYVDEKMGPEAWSELLTIAKIPQEHHYLSISSYPDEEMMNIINAISVKQKRSTTAILKEYGKFLGKYLIKTYAPLIDPNWHTLDLIEKTENYIHSALKVQDRNVKPPKLVTERINNSTVIIHYTSPRKMCALSEGIAQAIAEHYHEKILITQTQCMHLGDPECTIVIKLVH